MRVSSNSMLTNEQVKVFSKELHKLRTEAGLSAKDLAELVGISQMYVYNLENGKRRPSPQLVDRVASAFGIRASDIFNPPRREPSRERVEYGRKLLMGRINKGYTRSMVAGALGIPVSVYVEFERGECSITDRQKELLEKLLDIGEKPAVETRAKETPVAEDPIDVCNIILEHIKDLKVDSETQKKVWRYFTYMKISEEERKLFG